MFMNPSVMYQPNMAGMGQPQPMMQPQGVQWNNAPMSNQPMNVTQTGVPFQQIRNDLANMIAQNASSNMLTNILFQECSYNNFLNGKMDKLVSTTALIIDAEARLNPQAQLQLIYTNALNEAFNCAWAARFQQNPQLANDTTIQPLLGTIQQWNQQAQQRVVLFQQMGLLQQQPVQQVPQYMQGQPYNNGYPQYGQYQAPVNRPGMQVQNTVPQYAPTPVASNQQGNNDGLRATPSTIATLRQEMMEKGVSTSNPYGIPNSHQQFQPVQQQQSMRTPVIPNQAFQEQQKIVYGEQRLANQVVPTAVAVEEERLVPVGNARSMIQTNVGETSFWSSPQPQSHQPVSTLVQQVKDINDPDYGLREDEVCYLNVKQVTTMLQSGDYQYEPPFVGRFPYSGDPWTKAMHYTLLRNNKIRLTVTDLDEDEKQMERSTHHDVLRPFREKPELRKQMKGKSFVKSTQGGVQYDRFKDSRIVLSNALREASAEINEKGLTGEARFDRIQQAYEIWEKSWKRELEQDYNGVAQYIANNPSEDPEDPNLPNEIDLPTEEREERMTARLSQVVEEEIDDITPINNGFETAHQNNIEVLTESRPLTEDKIYHEIYETTEIIDVFNSPKEKREVMELLKPFVWKKEPTKQDIDDQLFTEDLAKHLASVKDKLPTNLRARLNIYGVTAVNKALKYMLQADATIEDFGDDYFDIIEWGKNKVVSGEWKDQQHPLALLSILIAPIMQCIADVSNITLMDDDVDQIESRAIVRTVCVQNSSIPVLASAAGLNLADTCVTKSTHPELFPIVHTQMDKHLRSRSLLTDKLYAPIAATYFTFAAGEKYRAWPIVNTQSDSGELSGYMLEYLGNAF